MNCIIVRYGEISLKGKNRHVFEKRLVRNIKDALKQHAVDFTAVHRLRNRLIIETAADCPFLKRVFGITSFSPAVKTQLTAVEKTAKEMTKSWKKGSFRVSTKKIVHEGTLHSADMNRTLGTLIESWTNLSVNLKHYDHELGVEIIKDDAYVFLDRFSGFGGLPVGCEGRVYLLMEDEASVLAGLLMMRRGCAVLPVGNGDYSLLEKYAYGTRIVENEMDDDTVSAVVAGQTLTTFKKIENKLPVLRPLIGFTEEEIHQRLEEFSD